MRHSRLCALLIDCKTEDIDEAAAFWAAALGRAVDRGHPETLGNYRMLETPPDEPIVEIQRVEHESRVHIDMETDERQPMVGRTGIASPGQCGKRLLHKRLGHAYDTCRRRVGLPRCLTQAPWKLVSTPLAAEFRQ